MPKVKAPPVHVTLSVFDSVSRNEPSYRNKREHVPIGTFVPITQADYSPRGSTPLRDAVAEFIGHLDQLKGDGHVTIGLLLDESGSMATERNEVIEGVNSFVAGMTDVKAVDKAAAGTVLAVIVTDGEENASHETSPEAVKAMIADREKDGWTFIYLGSGIDAWHQGQALGLSGSSSGQMVSTTKSSKGVNAAFASVTADSSSYLSGTAAYRSDHDTLGTSMRSVTDTGAVLDSNINATVNATPGHTGAPPSAWPVQSYSGAYLATDAMAKARRALAKEEDES